MRLEYEPSSEPLHVSAKQLFLHSPAAHQQARFWGCNPVQSHSSLCQVTPVILHGVVSPASWFFEFEGVGTIKIVTARFWPRLPGNSPEKVEWFSPRSDGPLEWGRLYLTERVYKGVM